jgi:hypothetical protein
MSKRKEADEFEDLTVHKLRKADDSDPESEEEETEAVKELAKAMEKTAQELKERAKAQKNIAEAYLTCKGGPSDDEKQITEYAKAHLGDGAYKYEILKGDAGEIMARFTAPTKEEAIEAAANAAAQPTNKMIFKFNLNDPSNQRTFLSTSSFKHKYEFNNLVPVAVLGKGDALRPHEVRMHALAALAAEKGITELPVQAAFVAIKDLKRNDKAILKFKITFVFMQDPKKDGYETINALVDAYFITMKIGEWLVEASTGNQP